MINLPTQDPRPAMLAKFTSHQRLILKLLCEGLSNREIGEEMLITEKTVKFHLTIIYKTLQVRSDRECISKYKEFV